MKPFFHPICIALEMEGTSLPSRLSLLPSASRTNIAPMRPRRARGQPRHRCPAAGTAWQPPVPSLDHPKPLSPVPSLATANTTQLSSCCAQNLGWETCDRAGIGLFGDVPLCLCWCSALTVPGQGSRGMKPPGRCPRSELPPNIRSLGKSDLFALAPTQ